jgi:hypothetical protein
MRAACAGNTGCEDVLAPGGSMVNCWLDISVGLAVDAIVFMEADGEPGG